MKRETQLLFNFCGKPVAIRVVQVHVKRLKPQDSKADPPGGRCMGNMSGQCVGVAMRPTSPRRSAGVDDVG
jgi:hypothetical protein